MNTGLYWFTNDLLLEDNRALLRATERVKQLLWVYTDVASNWRNWQYFAGVGADLCCKLRFNIDKQRLIYDPERVFISKWGKYGFAPFLVILKQTKQLTSMTLEAHFTQFNVS